MIYKLLEPEHKLLLHPLPEITAETEPESRQELLDNMVCLLYTSPSPRDVEESRMPSSA